jgi:nitrogen-specific signal transduction histidine kinase
VTDPTTRADSDFEHRAILAEDRLRTMSMLIAGVTHEINNPLTAIQGLVSLLRTEVPDESSRDDLDIVLTETERTVRIVRNLRAFAGRADEPRMSQLNDGVRQVVDTRGYEIRARGIEITLDQAPDLSYVSATVPELLFLTLQLVLWAEQVLLDAPPREEDEPGGARIAPKLTLRTSLNEADCHAQLTVSHDGEPLDADLLTALAAPGEAMVDPGTRRMTLARHPTMLALDYAAAELGGTLAGRNLPGRGAELTVSIPAATGEASVAALQ